MKHAAKSLCLAITLVLPIAAATALSGCAGDRYGRSTGEYIDDKSLNSRVRLALADNPNYKFSDVNITSFRGKIQLSGFVNTEEQKRRAGEIAGAVQGAKGVENNITVKEKLE